MSNKIRKYFDKHHKLRKFFNAASDFMDVLTLVSLIISLVLVFGIVALVLILSDFPDEIKSAIFGITGSAFSIVIIPLFFDSYNRKKERDYEIADNNLDIYKDLFRIMFNISVEHEKAFLCHKQIKTFIAKNYFQMCISFPAPILSEIYDIEHELELNCLENAKMHCKKCMQKIRKYYGQSGVAWMGEHWEEIVSESSCITN